MTLERWQQIQQLFHATLACAPDQRAGFVASACGGDEPLRLEVESLISFHTNDQSFIETPAGDVAADMLRVHEPVVEPGQQIENYRIVRRLGSGGMGEVYLADDLKLNRKIALKILPPKFIIDADRVRRFEQEARAASALNHPNIVTIHEIGHSNSTQFIATEFIDGSTLREHLANTSWTLAEKLDVTAQVASALTAAHAAGIVHRDIKPENIMLRRDGFVKVLDFGLAKLTSPSIEANQVPPEESPTFETNPGMVMGTVQYMSPEQARGAEVDARTDLWSLGVVLYETVSGHTPFEGETPSHVIVSILEREPPPLSLGAEVPGELERIISKALRKERLQRYQTAHEMALDLKSLKEELTVELRVKQFRRSTNAGRGAATRSGKRLSLSATASSGDVARARLTSSAGYVVQGVKRHKAAVVFASTAVLLLVASLLYFWSVNNRAGGEPIDSVAVLPFVNVSNDPNAQYLSDGLSDSVINSLSQLPGIKRVISLNSALRYKGQQVDPQTVGREFNVQAVLMGRLTQQGADLWISAELVDVRDNRRLWGEHYNRKLSDILVVQRDIAQQISSGLRLRLSGEEKKQIAKQYTENPNAEIAYLKGRYFHDKRTAQDTEKSIEYLEEAIRLDPNYALAYATLANSYLSLANLGARFRIEEVLPKAKEAVEKALAIDDTLAEAHAALGSIRFFSWDWSGAEREFKRAIELNPNYKPINPNYAQYLLNKKRFDEAVAESRRVLELDPVSAYYNRNVAMILYVARRYDEAIEQCQKTLELEPNMGVAYNWLWRAYEQKGLYDQSVEAYLRTGQIKQHSPETVAALREAYATSGWKGFWRKALDLSIEQAKRGVNLYTVAENYARLGEKDQALVWLEKAIEQREVAVTVFIRNPFWDGFRSDPRFADLIRRMGLEP